jgi:uncharacterized protein
MTPQEQDMIGGLIDRVQKMQLVEKDMDAEQMLQQGLGRNPDALYILAQTVLVQKYALEQAQAQLTQAKAQIEQMQQHPEPKHATSFLGSLLGRNDAPAPPPPPPPQQQGYPVQGQAYPPYAPVSGYGGGAPQYGAPMASGGGGGFFQGALQTAAGVAAGALAFEGVESLMHGFGHAAGYGGGSGFGGFDGGQQRPEEVINNYYGDDKGDRGGHDVSADERSLGQQEDRDFGSGGSGDSKDDRDSLYGADGSDSIDDASFDSDTSSNDTSFDDGGGDFGDDGSGGGDDSNFA